MATSPITMRIEPHVLNRIDQAARMSGKSRSAFMIELALEKAEAMLPDLDQTKFELSSVDYEQVMQLVEQEPDQSKLSRLLDTNGLPWASS